MLPRSESTTRGNAPAEFILGGALLVALAIATLQISLIVHVRSVLQASAWEGARHASYYNTTLSDGVTLTRNLIQEGVGDRYAEHIVARSSDVAGRPGVIIHVESPFPALGMWSPGGTLRVSAAVPHEIPD